MPAHDQTLWVALADTPAVAIGATTAFYVLALKLQRRFACNPILNPTLVTVMLVASVIELTGVPYQGYLQGAGFFNFMLGLAVVLLAIPLYRQTRLIRASWPVIAVALAVGLPCGIVSAVGAARILHARPETLLSLAPKSVTSGIAVGVSEAIGGIPALTVVFVILTGIVGGVAGPAIVRFAGVKDERVLGLAMGIGSHGIGTARAIQISEVAGAFSGLGMSLNGVTTAVLLPLLASLLRG